MAAFELKSSAFRAEREVSWRELEILIDRAERKGRASLSGEDLLRLSDLYRGAVSSLSVAQAISLDRNLIAYLSNLVARAYIFVYGSKRRASEAILELVRRTLPRTVRAFGFHLALAILCLVAGALCGGLLTFTDLDRYYGLVPEELAQDRSPDTDAATLRSILYQEKDTEAERLNYFSTFLFTHNAKVGILCFALGFAAGIPVFILVFQNGLTLGALAGLYQARGLGLEFWAWILPHGITELLAVCLCGTAGLVAGAAVVFPGRHARVQNLALHGRRIVILVVGAIALFFMAALIEGFFRQLVHGLLPRLSMAAATLALWLAYFGLAGREDAS